jgi:hypothetical protein
VQAGEKQLFSLPGVALISPGITGQGHENTERDHGNVQSSSAPVLFVYRV